MRDGGTDDLAVSGALSGMRDERSERRSEGDARCLSGLQRGRCDTLAS